MKPNEEQRRAALAAFLRANGRRVRRATAMRLLCVEDPRTFQKVVDANQQLAHKLKGETQPKYLVVEIFALLPMTAWCATSGEGLK